MGQRPAHDLSNSPWPPRHNEFRKCLTLFQTVEITSYMSDPIHSIVTQLTQITHLLQQITEQQSQVLVRLAQPHSPTTGEPAPGPCANIEPNKKQSTDLAANAKAEKPVSVKQSLYQTAVNLPFTAASPSVCVQQERSAKNVPSEAAAGLNSANVADPAPSPLGGLVCERPPAGSVGRVYKTLAKSTTLSPKVDRTVQAVTLDRDELLVTSVLSKRDGGHGAALIADAQPERMPSLGDHGGGSEMAGHPAPDARSLLDQIQRFSETLNNATPFWNQVSGGSSEESEREEPAKPADSNRNFSSPLDSASSSPYCR